CWSGATGWRAMAEARGQGRGDLMAKVASRLPPRASEKGRLVSPDPSRFAAGLPGRATEGSARPRAGAATGVGCFLWLSHICRSNGARALTKRPTEGAVGRCPGRFAAVNRAGQGSGRGKIPAFLAATNRPSDRTGRPGD